MENVLKPLAKSALILLDYQQKHQQQMIQKKKIFIRYGNIYNFE